MSILFTKIFPFKAKEKEKLGEYLNMKSLNVTPLHIAAKYGSSKIMKYLISNENVNIHSEENKHFLLMPSEKHLLIYTAAYYSILIN